MAKVFLLSIDENYEIGEIQDDEINIPDEIICLTNENTYFNIVKWLIDNSFNYHYETQSDGNIVLIMRDDDAMAFKLRWG